MKKKLIGFGLALEDRINYYANQNDMDFTKAVRSLVEIGLNHEGVAITDDIEEETIINDVNLTVLQQEVEQLKKDTGWFKADDSQSRIGNIELNIAQLEKKISVLISSSKLFKKHIDNDDIHLRG